MYLKPLTITACMLTLAAPLHAQSATQINDLVEALSLNRIVEIMREEGLAGSDTLAENMLGGVPPEWNEIMQEVYDFDRMQAAMTQGLETVLEGQDPQPITAFFTSELGTTIIGLELSAREAFMEPEIEEMAELYSQSLADDQPERYALLQEFISVNDLIDSNVVGGLNSNLAFFEGLAAGGMMDPDVTQDQLLRQIYEQEPDIRRDTTIWLDAFLAMAYRPLSDEEINLYLDFSRSEHGQLMNKVLFEAFDGMFADISHGLGLAVARFGATEEL